MAGLLLPQRPQRPQQPPQHRCVEGAACAETLPPSNRPTLAPQPQASDGKEAEPAPEPARERPHHPLAPAPAPRSSDDGGGGKMAEPADAAAGGGGDAFQPPSAFGADGSVGRTQEILQPLISKPKLSDKLLGRPPLRFLHDVLSAVQDATGWGAGLLPPELASSSSVKVKENKAVFLDLFINAVALDLRTFIPASPTNIMAGKECADTNVLLQLLGIAAQRGNGAAAVAAVHAGERQATSYPGAGTPQPQAAPAPAPAPAPTPAPAPAPAPAPTEWGGKTDEGGTGEPAGSFAGAFAGGSEALAPEVAPDTSAPPGPRSIRPSTARRRPPKVKEGGSTITASGPGARVDGTVSTAAPKGLMTEGDDGGDSDEEEAAGEAGVFGGGSADPSRGGAGRLTKEILADMGDGGDGKEAEDGSIRFGRISRRAGEGSFGTADVQDLRKAIQRLVQSTNPLGKSMEYVGQDLDEMKAELAQWRGQRKRHVDSMGGALRTTRDALAPYQKRLLVAEEQCREMSRRITAIRATIAKNDEKIRTMIMGVVTRTASS